MGKRKHVAGESVDNVCRHTFSVAHGGERNRVGRLCQLGVPYLFFRDLATLVDATGLNRAHAPLTSPTMLQEATHLTHEQKTDRNTRSLLITR